VFEPGPSAIVIVSIVPGPRNAMSRDALGTPLITIVSCAVASTSGKFWYTNWTCVHEMSIVLVCAEAGVESITMPSAVSTSCPPNPVTARAPRR
jgi:hypothetical protein